MLCVGDGRRGRGGGGGCVAAGSGTTPEPRRATPLYQDEQSKAVVALVVAIWKR